MQNKKAVVLWSGGKDCNLALYEAVLEGYQIVSLISFARREPRFKAHPISIIRAQSEALSIPHQFMEVEAPYESGYENAIGQIKKQEGVETLVTGDISEVGGYSNWMKERARNCGVQIFSPLWHRDRGDCLSLLLSHGFEAIFSCVKQPWFTSGWLGERLSEKAIRGLKGIQRDREMDLCGEEGEYHTVVVDGPLYKKRLEVEAFSEKSDGPLRYMDITRLNLIAKDPPKAG